MWKIVPVLLSLLSIAVLSTACASSDTVEDRLEDRYGWKGTLPKPAADVEAGKEVAVPNESEKKAESGIVSTVDQKDVASAEIGCCGSTAASSSDTEKPPVPPVAEKAPAEKTQPASGETKEHIVKVNENLWGLAVREYGNGEKWTVIYEANKDVLKDNPNLIRPGTKLRIPLLKKTEIPDAGDKAPIK